MNLNYITTIKQHEVSHEGGFPPLREEQGV